MTEDRKQPELMTPSKAARRLGVSRNTIMHRVATKQYRSEVVGGVTFVWSADIEAAVEDRAA
jgi:hypothetical protein